MSRNRIALRDCLEHIWKRGKRPFASSHPLQNPSNFLPSRPVCWSPLSQLRYLILAPRDWPTSCGCHEATHQARRGPVNGQKTTFTHHRLHPRHLPYRPTPRQSRLRPLSHQSHCPRLLQRPRRRRHGCGWSGLGHQEVIVIDLAFPELGLLLAA